MRTKIITLTLVCAVSIALVLALGIARLGTRSAVALDEPQTAQEQLIDENANGMLSKGRQIFRYATFGDEAFWGNTLKLHQAIEGAANGGVGPGVSPKTALAVGLKVDMDKLPAALVDQIKAGKVDLDSPATTLALLRLGAVVGVQGFFDDQPAAQSSATVVHAPGLRSIGITCALCHSTVDNAFAPGIGHRLDGWPNRDLNVGAIVALAPDLSSVTKLLGVDKPTLLKVLHSWGPGKFDAEVFLDGKAFQPDGRSAAVLIPAAFGLAGVNLSTYEGWGSTTEWNAFVANLEMHGSGTLYDPRLKNPAQFPISTRAGFNNVRNTPDYITSELAALHFYQLAIPAPKPPAGSFDPTAAARGAKVFAMAKCSACHVPPLYTEPGYNLHTPAEIGIDAFQADRAPTHGYRTTPLAGLFARAQGGYYHDGRFPDLAAVVNHYNSFFHLNLSASEKADLIQYLKSL
jgi:cytochrome c5